MFGQVCRKRWGLICKPYISLPRTFALNKEDGVNLLPSECLLHCNSLLRSFNSIELCWKQKQGAICSEDCIPGVIPKAFKT